MSQWSLLLRKGKKNFHLTVDSAHGGAAKKRQNELFDKLREKKVNATGQGYVREKERVSVCVCVCMCM